MERDQFQKLHLDVSLQGNIAIIGLDIIFQLIDLADLSGELRVESENNSGSFFFENGMLIFGALANNKKRIGELLLESGLITQEQLSYCLKIHENEKRHGRRFGNVLLRKNILSYEKLVKLLEQQTRNAFFEVLSWKKGVFFFYAFKSPSNDNILIKERVGQLLMEGLIHLDSNKKII